MAHFTPFEIGQIKAHAYHGMSGAAISKILFKPGSTSGRGSKTWSEQAVQDVIKKLRDFPWWRGERDEGSGRPRETTKAQDNTIYKEVLKSRGEACLQVILSNRQFCILALD